MSIATELENYSTYLSNAYNKANEKGATIPQNKNLQNLTNCIDSIPTGTVEIPSKDVDFLDYDGTILYSYTATEFANLTALPANPTHDGLTSQGWNWTLTDAKAYVASFGMLDIGQLYMPTDEKKHIYVEIEAEFKYIATAFRALGTVEVDWGDSTAISTISGANEEATLLLNHTYANAGSYCIKMNVTSGYAILASSSASSILFDNHYGVGTYDIIRKMVKKIEIGKNFYIGEYAFANLFDLSAITFPATAPTGSSTASLQGVGNYSFAYTTNLKTVILPSWVVLMGHYAFQYSALKRISISGRVSFTTYCFYYCFDLQRVALPSGCDWGSSQTALFRYCKNLERVSLAGSYTSATVANYFFQYCSSLGKIKFPCPVGAINQNSMSTCTSLKEVDLSLCTSVPSLYSYGTITTGTPSNLRIIVPDNLYDTWIATSPWNNATLKSRIVKASQA